MPGSEGPGVSDLLAQARGGDVQALNGLFAACRGYLAVIARTHVEGKLRAKVDASDLVQQTLLEAYRDFPRFQGTTEEAWLAWLRQVLSHNAADFLRAYQGTGKRQAGREVALDGLAPSSGGSPAPPAPGESPSQQVVRMEQELRVAEALARLPEEYQEVIRLRNLQRLPFDEVARRMDRSRPAAQMLWMRAIHKLQEMVRDEN